jgi:hypothetical protein
VDYRNFPEIPLGFFRSLLDFFFLHDSVATPLPIMLEGHKPLPRPDITALAACIPARTPSEKGLP